MASTSVLVRREGGTVVATLNRPDKLNALNKEMLDELQTLVDLLETDKTARVLIITGAGEKAFSVGADLKERQHMNSKDVMWRIESVHKLQGRLEKLHVPVIAALNGITQGAGLELALSCDLRVAVDGANLGLTEVDLAVIPGSGGTQRLPRLVGMARALELVLLAKRLSAAEALHIGLVHAVVPAHQSLSHALAWAGKLVESAPIAIRQAKAAIRQGLERPLEHGLQLEAEAYRACLYSKDRQEGLKAYAEKRKPVYHGE